MEDKVNKYTKMLSKFKVKITESTFYHFSALRSLALATKKNIPIALSDGNDLSIIEL